MSYVLFVIPVRPDGYVCAIHAACLGWPVSAVEGARTWRQLRERQRASLYLIDQRCCIASMQFAREILTRGA